MTIFHIDANSAYLSWTAVWLLEQGYPLDIRTVPSCIAGDPDNRHGIILAKSIPAKAFGIGTADSLFQVRQKCPDVLVFPPNYDLYLSCSNAMVEILKEYSHQIQRYSIDECFIEYVGQGLAGSPTDRNKEHTQVAFEIKERIKEELGFTVNVGVGPNKVLAKMAGELKKPDRVNTIFENEIEDKLWPLPVRELFMVGSATERKLKAININTVGELATSDPFHMEALLKSHGRLVWEYANGIDNSKVVPNKSVKQKSVGNGITAPYDLENFKEAHQVILALCDRTAMRLRRLGVKASVISLYIKNKNFFGTSHQLKIKYHTDSTTEIFAILCQLLRECWKGDPIRQISISLSGFEEAGREQLTIYNMNNFKKEEDLNQVVDEIRNLYGEKSIIRGTFVNGDVDPLQGGVNDGDYLMMGGYSL